MPDILLRPQPDLTRDVPFEIGILIIPALQMGEQEIRKILFKARKVTSTAMDDTLVNQGDQWGLGSYSK